MSTWILLNAIGHDNTLKLQRWYGGGYLRVRQQIHENADLVKVIGVEATQKLLSKIQNAPECSEGRIYIGRDLVRRERNAAIVRERRKGASLRSLSVQFGMGEDAIRWVLRGYADDLKIKDEELHP